MARELVVKVYGASECFPSEEVYGMRRQLRNAASSIAANIAEGFGRSHHKDNLKFLYNARGSLAETESSYENESTGCHAVHIFIRCGEPTGSWIACNDTIRIQCGHILANQHLEQNKTMDLRLARSEGRRLSRCVFMT